MRKIIGVVDGTYSVRDLRDGSVSHLSKDELSRMFATKKIVGVSDGIYEVHDLLDGTVVQVSARELMEMRHSGIKVHGCIFRERRFHIDVDNSWHSNIYATDEDQDSYIPRKPDGMIKEFINYVKGGS